MGQWETKTNTNNLLSERCLTHLVRGTFNPPERIFHANTALLHEHESFPNANWR